MRDAKTGENVRLYNPALVPLLLICLFIYFLFFAAKGGHLRENGERLPRLLPTRASQTS